MTAPSALALSACGPSSSTPNPDAGDGAAEASVATVERVLDVPARLLLVTEDGTLVYVREATNALEVRLPTGKIATVLADFPATGVEVKALGHGHAIALDGIAGPSHLLRVWTEANGLRLVNEDDWSAIVSYDLTPNERQLFVTYATADRYWVSVKDLTANAPAVRASDSPWCAPLVHVVDDTRAYATPCYAPGHVTLERLEGKDGSWKNGGNMADTAGEAPTLVWTTSGTHVLIRTRTSGDGEAPRYDAVAVELATGKLEGKASHAEQVIMAPGGQLVWLADGEVWASEVGKANGLVDTFVKTLLDVSPTFGSLLVATKAEGTGRPRTDLQLVGITDKLGGIVRIIDEPTVLVGDDGDGQEGPRAPGFSNDGKAFFYFQDIDASGKGRLLVDGGPLSRKTLDPHTSRAVPGTEWVGIEEHTAGAPRGLDFRTDLRAAAIRSDSAPIALGRGSNSGLIGPRGASTLHFSIGSDGEAGIYRVTLP